MASRPPAITADSAYIQPRAAWKLTLDGVNLADKIAPRLISLKLSEKRGEAADELELDLHDHDGALVLPREGARLALWLGWERGTGVTPGLVHKGTFKVDDVSWDGPPDKVAIRARSADLSGSFRTRRSQVWARRRLGDIVAKIAATHGLKPRCHPDLAGIEVTSAEQHNKSDMQFLRDLGRRYDAVATVKDGRLIFAPIDADTTATGKAIPALTITRASGDRYSYRRAERDRGHDGAEAQWHDSGGAKRRTAKSGGTHRRRLKRVYASEGDAKAAARSEANRQKRAAATLELILSYGDPAIAPGVKVTAKGFKSEIDGRQWRVASVEHTMDAGGYRTRLELEAAG